MCRWFSCSVLLAVQFFSVAFSTQCSEVSRSYTAMGFNAVDVPLTVTTATDLRVCPKGYSCCTVDMETNLAGYSRRDFDQRLVQVTKLTRNSLVANTARFNDFFTQSVQRGQSELHSMFDHAYGAQYRQNEEVFTQLFTDFQDYYKGANINLSARMKQFFDDVFLRMFRMQNPEYDLTDSYMRCVSDTMKNITPFGETPEILSRNVRQAFVASRTFVQGLAVGRNVALKVAEVEPTAICSEAFMKMTFCPHCQGLPQLKPCNNYCLNVMKGCLAYHAELNDEWTKYIDAMDELATRLEGDGAFNIEAVINPFKDMISTAIMEYHSNSIRISQQIFSPDKCGSPPVSKRKKRAANFNFRGSLPQRPASRKASQLNRLVRDIKDKLKVIKDIWSMLSVRMCEGGLSASPTAGSNCWNGEAEESYGYPLMMDGLSANKDNREVKVNPNRPNQIITEQIEKLKKVTNKLSDAKLGINVDWLNLEISVDAPLEMILLSDAAEPQVINPKLDGFDVRSSISLDIGSGYEGSGSLSIISNYRPRKPIVDDTDGSGIPPRVIPISTKIKNKNVAELPDDGSGREFDTDQNQRPELTHKVTQPLVRRQPMPSTTVAASSSRVHSSILFTLASLLIGISVHRSSIS